MKTTREIINELEMLLGVESAVLKPLSRFLRESTLFINAFSGRSIFELFQNSVNSYTVLCKKISWHPLEHRKICIMVLNHLIECALDRMFGNVVVSCRQSAREELTLFAEQKIGYALE